MSREEYNVCRRTIVSCISSFRDREVHDINGELRIQIKSLCPLRDKYPDAYEVFKVLFDTFSYGEDRWTAASPPRLHSIFMFFPNIKGKLKCLRIFLSQMCKANSHYEALFDVFVENYGVFRHKSCRNHWKYFFLNSLMMIRIFQWKHFPSGDCETVLLTQNLKRIVRQKIEQKSGFASCFQRHFHLRKYFSRMNRLPNEKHSNAIRSLIESDPTFFSTAIEHLNVFFSRLNYQYDVVETETDKVAAVITRYTLTFYRLATSKAESYWIRLMDQGCPELLAKFREHSIDNDTISWILYWYFYQSEFPNMSFSNIMLELVQPGKMSFPSPQPPKIFSNDHSSRGQNTCLLKSPSITIDSLLGICGILDYPSEVRPAAKVIAQSCRSICVRQKGNDIICERFFEIFINPTIHSFLVKSMLASRKAYFIQRLEPEYALKKQNPGLRKYLNRFTQKHLLRLKNMPFWNLLIRRIFFNK